MALNNTWLALLCLLIAAFLFLFARRKKDQTGLPGGQIFYEDMGRKEAVAQAFFDPRLNLTGKPDYIVRQGKALIPVEVKTGRTPPEPYDAHIFQLAAYCYLVDQATGIRPPYGLINYPKQTFKIDYSTELEEILKLLIQQMRSKGQAGAEIKRSHEEPSRCRRCGFRHVCDQRLA